MTTTQRHKRRLGGILLLLGLMGILSLLTVELPTSNLPPETLERFSPQMIKFLSLLNPLIFLVISILIGLRLYPKTSLRAPLIESLLQDEKPTIPFPMILKSGILGGLLAGILLVLIGWIYRPLMPLEFTELGKNLQMNMLTRLLYGGLTEEILLRFGLMTLLVWLFLKICKSRESNTYWIAIIATALLFAVSHFPIAFQAVNKPSGFLLSYILIGNSLGGLIFGWLYWKKGLESAFVAHMVAHIVLVAGDWLILA